MSSWDPFLDAFKGARDEAKKLAETLDEVIFVVENFQAEYPATELKKMLKEVIYDGRSFSECLTGSEAELSV